MQGPFAALSELLNNDCFDQLSICVQIGGKGHSWMNRTPMILSNYRRSISRELLLEQDFAFPLADSLSILDLLVHA